ncbi:hypothetical protein BGX31_009664, partial [Mortierella sp. GBA43]
MSTDVFFKTGTHHVLCKIPGLDQTEFPYPSDYQDRWDRDHVRLPCSTSSTQWSEIVQGLTTSITNSQQLSKIMARWNGGDSEEWNLQALEVFLNQKADQPHTSDPEDRRRDYESPRMDLSDMESDREREEGVHSDEDVVMEDGTNTPNAKAGRGRDSGARDGKNRSPDSFYLPEADYFDKDERDRFFNTILPKMQALALRLPELVKKPIPLLKQDQDNAVTLSQEQIACLLANAFFNTFPCRNKPYRGTRKRRVSESASAQDTGKGGQSSSKRKHSGGPTVKQAPKETHGNHTKAKGGLSGEFRNTDGQMSLFAYFGRVDPKASATAASKDAPKELTVEPRHHDKPDSITRRNSIGSNNSRNTSESIKEDGHHDSENKNKAETEQPKGESLQFPSINFWTLFTSDDPDLPCSPSNAAKLRCIINYFDRVTTNMPKGAVTYHRQVLRSRISLESDERINTEQLSFVQVRVDLESPLEDESPLGALQLDFANKVIGGGVLGYGAVQEEIRFAICPELIISRLFTLTLQDNEALLIKGAERYSNYNGYGYTFTWHSNHIDNTPRDSLGRRKTEICAIDAIPFRSKDHRLRQFSRHNVLRELNKAIVGFRRSPITASEWGLCRAEPLPAGATEVSTGNWGCGVFGGHLQLKFLIQLMAASLCGCYSKDDQDDSIPPGRNVVYYTYGLDDLGKEIGMFMDQLVANPRVFDPSLILECIMQYPNKSSKGYIIGLPQKSLLNYIATALGISSNSFS